MKTLILTFLGLFIGFLGNAQQNVIAHYQGVELLHLPATSVDSIKLGDANSDFHTTNFFTEIPINQIDSLTFSTTASTHDKIYIIYNEEEVTVINPYENQGISIESNQAAVTVNSTIGTSGIEYHILGTSASGNLIINSQEDLTLALNNLTLTSTSSPAIWINSAINTTVELVDDSYNTLADTSENSEDGLLHTAGNWIFTGSGNLNLTALGKHAIYSDGNTLVENGNIDIENTANDGIHSEGFTLDGGNITIYQNQGDGIDAGAADVVLNDGSIALDSSIDDINAIKTDGNITINGGDFNLNLTGDQSKGLNSESEITINNGNL